MKIEDIKTMGVMGAGVMGGGISQTAILAGYNVICRDLTDEILAKAKDTMINGRFGLKGGVERGKHTQQQVDEALARLTLTTKVEDLKDCDFVIEAIGGGPGQLENKPMKIKVFGEIDKIVKKEAIFASNTSYFTIADLAAATERKDRFLGVHWFSPANIMKLAEVIYTPEVKEEVIQVVEELCKRLGKTSVRVKDMPGDLGHIANRIFYRGVAEEARKVVEEGVASPQDVDTAMKLGFNWPAGPFELGAGARSGWG